MEHRLTFTTDSMDVCINNYEPYSFEYEGWTVSDKYVHNEKNPRGSSYTIIISSPLFSDEEELNNYRLSGQDIVNIITTLIPVCGLPSLNSPKFNDFLKDQYLIDYKSAPQGWNTNYSEELDNIKQEIGSKIQVKFECMGFSRYTIINKTPLKELELLLNKYNDIQEDVIFLIFLNYSILTSSDKNVYVLIGKAIEMIDAMYPNEDNGKKGHDKRIEKLFPELTDVFQSFTIHKLKGLANTRKEARHYNDNKNNNLPHQSLTKDERINMYKCTTCLIMNVIRDKFGLSHEHIVFSK